MAYSAHGDLIVPYWRFGSSDMVITPLSRVIYTGAASNGLKDNMPSKSAKPRRPDLREKASARRVAIVAFPGVTLLDISGPAQVFAELQEIELPSASYSLSYLSTSGGLVPTDVGMMIDTAPIEASGRTRSIRSSFRAARASGSCGRTPVLMKWIVETLPKARRVASVCLGAFVLAWTGVLDGKRAATHWRYCPRLADGFPSIRVEPNAIFVKDGRVWSSAGVSAGIDLALAMIEEDFGHTTALDIARRLVVFLKRPGGQSQFSTVLAAQASDVEGRFQRAARLDHREQLEGEGRDGDLRAGPVDEGEVDDQLRRSGTATSTPESMRNTPIRTGSSRLRGISPRSPACRAGTTSTRGPASSYDVFGNGRTALKGSFGRYVTQQVVAIATANNPINKSINSVTRSWTDTNKNYYPDCDLENPFQNLECGQISDLNFGKDNPRATQYADEVIHGFGNRGYVWDSSVELQHRLNPAVTLTGGYYPELGDQLPGDRQHGRGTTGLRHLLCDDAGGLAPAGRRRPAACDLWDVTPPRSAGRAPALSAWTRTSANRRRTTTSWVCPPTCGCRAAHGRG